MKKFLKGLLFILGIILLVGGGVSLFVFFYILATAPTHINEGVPLIIIGPIILAVAIFLFVVKSKMQDKEETDVSCEEEVSIDKPVETNTQKPKTTKSKTNSNKSEMTYEKAMWYFYHHKYDLAEKYLLELAKKGNIQAMIKLSEYYCDNYNDNDVFWGEKAAKSNKPEAIFNLAMLYYRHHDDHTYEEVYKMLEKAYKGGCVDALYAMALLTKLGEGTTQDEKLSQKMIKQAAEEGSSPAYMNLANSEKDYAVQFKYFEKAAELNDPEGLYRVSLCYYYGEEVPEDQAKAKELLLKSASLGCDYAIDSLLEFYGYDFLKEKP